HVLPDVFLFPRTAVRQEVGGVVGAQDGDAAVVVETAAQLAQRERRAQQRLGGRAAERADEFRTDQLNLPLEEAATVGRLAGQRRATRASGDLPRQGL